MVGNVDARPLSTSDEVKSELRRQLTSCVQWNRGVQYMIGQGVSEFVEVGNGKVLSGMIRRIDRNAKVRNVSDFESVWAYAEAA